jgi:hypothetical protein
VKTLIVAAIRCSLRFLLPTVVYAISAQCGLDPLSGNGTLQKMIVKSGSATMDIDLDRFTGINSTAEKVETLRFAVAANSFFPTKSRTARRNFSRSAGLSASSLRFSAPAMVFAQAMPCCSTNRSQRSSAITSIRLETERFSKDAICSSLFRCSSLTVRLSFDLLLFFLILAFRSFLHLFFKGDHAGVYNMGIKRTGRWNREMKRILVGPR